MDKTKILVTCPPMLGLIEEFRPIFSDKNVDLVTPNVVQTLSEEELMEILPTVDAWIIGDDPATERVFEAGVKGKLKAAVKWGVGIDNVDFKACEKLGIPISNTPYMFGEEVADIAVAYVIGLARQIHGISNGVKKNDWPKPPGISLSGRTVALIGFGDIGKATADRLLALNMQVNVYDPFAKMRAGDLEKFEFNEWPDALELADFVVVTCALTPKTKHMINEAILARMKKDVRIVNISRGPIIDERALAVALDNNHVHSVALEVFETEPLPANSPLRNHELSIFGTHNGSNTVDAVIRASHKAIDLIFGFLNINKTNA